MIKVLENENLEKTISKGIWLVDFYADWCGPCKMMGEVLKELTDIDIIKVNIDAHQDIAAKYGVMSIPTLMFVKEGKTAHTEIGFIPREEIERIINDLKKAN